MNRFITSHAKILWSRSMAARLLFPVVSLLFFVGLLSAQPGQVAIARVEQMPGLPSPYVMRDWKALALKYDSLVYNLSASGQYLPLIRVQGSGYNYVQRPNFILHTYVGTKNPSGAEAINILPSLVGASLAGVDKSTQFGQNWVLMSQDFFNRRNGENIYLNNFGGKSGSDWWYDIMPNVFFYQLYSLYPGLGDSDAQFISVADRFLEAVRKMGGNDAPWTAASMPYRAWDFTAGKPNVLGVPEPEAAGGYAWVLYHAYKKTGNKAYLQGAEWAMEYLVGLDANPSYELQLPYGAFVAARMNAELGMDYGTGKLINWVFDRGALRGWGTIVGKWGGVDVSGLVGEANDSGNDYAFLMNGLQQAAALAPLVRYDKRYARAIGKWLLNLANASRLFFPPSLPASLQDGAEWSQAYDQDGAIGYEALRQRWNGKSPFATGDAIRGGWSATNLCLYGTSSVGYLGAITQKTNVEGVLQIDVLKTDFFRDRAYPTFLYYNPYPVAQSIQVAVGGSEVDIYEALQERFIARNVKGSHTLLIPPDQAVLVTFAPVGAGVSYRANQMLLNGVVVDYRQSQAPVFFPPRIQGLAAKVATVQQGDTTDVYAKIFDRDTPTPTLSWSASGGVISGSGERVRWTADRQGRYQITLKASDVQGQVDSARIELEVVGILNKAPLIRTLTVAQNYASPGQSLAFHCDASDANGDALAYRWTADAGRIMGSGPRINWEAPSSEGAFLIRVEVSDGKGGTASAEARILVKDFEAAGSGKLVAYYPFSGNAQDASGNALHGDPFGCTLTQDRFGRELSAYRFDGINDYIQVANQPLLNFNTAITLSLWFRMRELPSREAFLISHGSWQNRWKLSVIPGGKLRWTIHAENGVIRDLDSPLPMQVGVDYHVACTYDGKAMLLFLNGELHSFRSMEGKMKTSPVSLLMGQMLPSDAAYNFPGVLDEVRLYDYALRPSAIRLLFDEKTTSVQSIDGPLVRYQVYPNPVSSDRFWIGCEDCKQEPFTWELFNSSGQSVQRGSSDLPLGTGIPLVPGRLNPETYFLNIRDRRGKHLLPLVVLPH